MRIAVISDIHANVIALNAVLEDMRNDVPDQVFCCGDLVGYNPFPNETIDLIRESKIFSIAGNHDLAVSENETDLSAFWEVARNAVTWTRAELRSENMAYLKTLPRTTTVLGKFVLFHGSLAGRPFPEMGRISNQEVAHRTLADMATMYPDYNIGFFGHTHIARIFENDTSRTLEISFKNNTVKISPENRYLINPGSVCLSRDSDPRASYLIADTDRLRITLHKVEYDNRPVLRAAREAGLQEYRIYRLSRRWATRIRNRMSRYLPIG